MSLDKRNRSLRHVVVVTLTVTLASIGAGMATGEEPGWGPAEHVTPAGVRTSEAEILMAPSGKALAVWGAAIRRRTSGGTWYTAGHIAGQKIAGPQAGIADDGSLTVMWTRPGPGAVLVAATKEPGHRWTHPTALSKPIPKMDKDCNASTYHPDLAVGAAGAAVAVWEWGSWDCGPLHLQAAYKPAGGTWQHTVTFPHTMGPGGASAQAGVDGEGNAVILGNHRHDTVVSRKPVGRKWTDPLVLVPRSQETVLTVAADGTTLVTWLGRSADRTPQLMATVWVRGRKWKSPPPLDTEPSPWVLPAVGLDASGTATIGWVTKSHSILTTRLLVDGTWEPPATVEATGPEVYSIGIAVDPAGDAVLAWGRRRHLLEAAFRPADASWGPAEIVARQSPFIDGLAINGNGDAILSWVSSKGVVRDRWREAG